MPALQHPVAEMARSIRSYVGTNAAMLLTGGIGAAVFTILLVTSARVYDAVADADGVSGLDQPVLDYMLSVRSPEGALWVTMFTNLGTTEPMVIFGLLLVGGMFLRWRRRSILLLSGIAAAGALIFTAVGKTVVGRSRPPLTSAVPPYEYAPSFPSGHTLNSTVVAAVIAYLAVWLAKTVWVRVLAPLAAALWAGAMGLSRIYLGHHWLTDVIFGWVFGLAWLALLVTVHRVLLRLDRRDKRAVASGQPPELRPEAPDQPLEPREP